MCSWLLGPGARGIFALSTTLLLRHCGQHKALLKFVQIFLGIIYFLTLHFVKINFKRLFFYKWRGISFLKFVYIVFDIYYLMIFSSISRAEMIKLLRVMLRYKREDTKIKTFCLYIHIKNFLNTCANIIFYFIIHSRCYTDSQDV